MGAIIAIYNLDSTPIQEDNLKKIITACPEYSYNGYQLWFNKEVGLGHQNFQTISSPPSIKQPLFDSNTNTAITASSSLTNRENLRKRFLPGDNGFNYVSDAYLILKTYQKWGTECVNHLEGAFAFAIWDKNNQELFVARDHLGLRSIVYIHKKDFFMAATDILQILAHPKAPKQINQKKIVQYLAHLYQDQKSSFYQDIFYLPPGHCISVTSKGMREWQYWEIPTDKSIHYKNPSDYSNHFISLLGTEISKQINPEYKIGVSMSGGLDSPTLAALIYKQLIQANQSPPIIFSYIFNELKEADESNYIQSFLQLYKTKSVLIPADDKWTLKNYPDWPIEKGYVWADPYALLPQSIIEAASQNGVKQLITGHYGDVLFTGQQFWALDLLTNLQMRRLIKSLAKNKQGIQSIINYGLRPLVPNFLRSFYRHIHPRDLSKYHPGIHPRLIEQAQQEQRDELDNLQRQFPGAGKWQRYQSLKLNVFTQGFASIQKYYIKHGIKLIAPYFNKQLVEFVVSIPAYELGSPEIERALLRNAMRGILPNEILQRRKRTIFYPLMKKGLRDKELHTVQYLLKDPLTVEYEFIQGEWLQNEFKTFLAGNDEIFDFWLSLSLEIWLRAIQ